MNEPVSSNGDGPEVTIVITTHNRPHTVPRAMETALVQSGVDLEVVIVDDASVPPLELETDDPRVRFVRVEKSRGVSAARNVGLANARGRWITFLDDDDELLPSMVEVSLRAASQSSLPSPVAVLSGIEILDSSGRTEKVRLPMSLTKGKHYFLEESVPGRGFTVGNTLLIPRRLLQGLGGFDEELMSSVHSELLLRINAVCSIEGVPEVTYRIKRHTGANVHGNVRARALAMERTVAKHRETFKLHPASYARYLSAMGVAFVRAGMWLAALRATTRALLTYPRSWKVVRSFLISLAGPWPLSLYKKAR